jgi:hypothetical protein
MTIAELEWPCAVVGVNLQGLLGRALPTMASHSVCSLNDCYTLAVRTRAVFHPLGTGILYTQHAVVCTAGCQGCVFGSYSLTVQRHRLQHGPWNVQYVPGQHRWACLMGRTAPRNIVRITTNKGVDAAGLKVVIAAEPFQSCVPTWLHTGLIFQSGGIIGLPPWLPTGLQELGQFSLDYHTLFRHKWHLGLH